MLSAAALRKRPLGRKADVVAKLEKLSPLYNPEPRRRLFGATQLLIFVDFPLPAQLCDSSREEIDE